MNFRYVQYICILSKNNIYFVIPERISLEVCQRTNKKNIFYRKDFKIKNGSVRIILSEKKGREYVDSKKPTISTFY